MRFSTILSAMAAVCVMASGLVFGAYTETMTPDMPEKNLVADYGLVDDGAASDQSAVFQRAIDELAASGGGRIIVPKGTYRLAGVRLKSNIHLLFEAGTVIKPNWPPGTKTVVFLLDAERPPKGKATEADEKAFIENVSLRGLGGRWIVDYSDREPKKGEGVRAVLATMVRNFLIADLLIKDNFTTYCGITLTPLQTKRDTSDWPVSRATDGTVRNCRIINASPGYGLTQLHGAQSVHFENIRAKGGVTLRLETGAVGPQTGVYDITARNVVNKNGRCAVMLGPHSAVNGVVKVDGVRTVSSAYAVTIGLGGVKEGQEKIDPDATNGSFAEGSYVKNIHAVFGMHAQIKTHSILEIPEEYYDDLKLRWFDKFFEGPSIGAVRDNTEGHYHVIIENVTMEGFKYNADKPILTPADVRPGKWGKELQKWKETYQ
ncbi:hypothetical protein JCM19992_34670 [Thermostilla marina]